jgi:hypothetical protein
MTFHSYLKSNPCVHSNFSVFFTTLNTVHVENIWYASLYPRFTIMKLPEQEHTKRMWCKVHIRFAWCQDSTFLNPCLDNIWCPVIFLMYFMAMSLAKWMSYHKLLRRPDRSWYLSVYHTFLGPILILSNQLWEGMELVKVNGWGLLIQ